MKKQIILTTTALLILALTSMSFAQFQQRGPADRPHRGMERGERMNKFQKLDLSAEQEEQIDQLRTEHLKTLLPLRNKIGELKAELQTLSTAEKANMNAINAKIDELSAVKTKMMKEKAAHRQQVRALLTDEQRLKFDAHSGPGQGAKRKHKGKRGPGQHWN
jgi:Spy/CpxP family protein refolding chaperone